jgi:hypothetical protein
MVGYVLRAVDGLGTEVPRKARSALERRRSEAAASTLLVDGELVPALSALRAVGTPPIVLKGPAVARMLYDDPSLRPYGDLDVAVPEASRVTAAAALLAHGYVDRESPQDAAWRRMAGQVRGAASFHQLFASPRGPLVELHADMLTLGLRPICDSDRWGRARPLPGLAGALALAPEDQLVTLAVHAHKHGFERLIWLKDLELLVRRTESLDWSMVVDTAWREGVAASLWYALELARRLLGCQISSDLLRQLRPAPPVQLLYHAVWPVSAIARLEGRMHRRAVQLVAVDSWRGIVPNVVLMGRRRERVMAARDFLALTRTTRREGA